MSESGFAGFQDFLYPGNPFILQILIGLTQLNDFTLTLALSLKGEGMV